MADKPIIFSATMIRALLDGRKSQTRRIVKLPKVPPMGCWEPTTIGGGDGSFCADGTPAPLQHCIWHTHTGKCIGSIWQPGDRLWVRENCATWEGTVRDVVYRADLSQADWNDVKHDASSAPWKLRPSIHMPRWASRITLVVTDVRPERVQDISEADARAEGVEAGETSRGRMWKAYGDEPNCWVDTARLSFAFLWDSIHGLDAWGRNDWVWRIAFTVHRCNIDSVEA